MESENKQLREQLVSLLAQIAQLQVQLALNSHNSSRPPSSDSFKRPPKSPTNTSKKTSPGHKSGGQPGYAAATLE